MLGVLAATPDVGENAALACRADRIAENGLDVGAFGALARVFAPVVDPIRRFLLQLVDAEDQLGRVQKAGLVAAVPAGGDVDPVGIELDRVRPDRAPMDELQLLNLRHWPAPLYSGARQHQPSGCYQPSRWRRPARRR